MDLIRFIFVYLENFLVLYLDLVIGKVFFLAEFRFGQYLVALALVAYLLESSIV